jgi:hydrogenase maturation protease
MNPDRSVCVAVLGLGNLMRTDDGVGMLALAALAADPRMTDLCMSDPRMADSNIPASVRLIEGGTLGLDLLYSVEGAENLLVLDAVDAGEAPGTLMRFEGEAVDRLPCGRSVHLLGLSDLLGAMRLLECAPQRTVLLGVQPAETGWGTTLTGPVCAAIPGLLDASLAHIQAWLSAPPVEAS